jgi:hypothetical protein
MPAVGEQSAKLHALGEVLDTRSAKDIQIVCHESFLCMSWSNLSGGTDCVSYEEEELGRLRTQTRTAGLLTRAGGRHGSYAALLGMLGQDLDVDNIEVSSITEEQYGFRVSGLARGRYFNQLFPSDSLWAEIADRRAVPAAASRAFALAGAR